MTPVETKAKSCGESVLASLYNFFGRLPNSIPVSTLNDMIESLGSQGLSCVIVCPRIYLLFPPYFRLRKKFVRQSIAANLILSASRTAVVHYATAFQCYGLSGSWTHFTCDFYEVGKMIQRFDPISPEDIGMHGVMNRIDRGISGYHIKLIVKEERK